MMRRWIFSAAVLFSLTAGHAQDNLRIQLFAEADQLLQQVRTEHADLYSPQTFSRGMEAYADAEDYYKRSRNIEDIREKLKLATQHFKKALENVRQGEVTFTALMAARSDALTTDAPKYAGEKWGRAEALFKSAAQELEDGDLVDAKNEAGEAEAMYRAAELEAIQANYLNPARNLIKQAEQTDVDDNAPKALENARKLVSMSESLLKQNRYDTDEARQLAQRAKYEASHAIFLDKAIRTFKQNNKTQEDIIVTAEEFFAQIAAALNLQVEFDQGYESLTRGIVDAIHAHQEEIAQLKESVKRQEQEITNLNQQVTSMEGRLGSLTETEKSLQKKLEQQRQQEETIAAVDVMFTEAEGMVLRDGNNVIIRLYGLTFPVGKNTIEPRFFPLLTKVQDAIRKFPGSQVAIEGHTDSQGSDDANQRLSESRAEAVAQYLKANMGTAVPIASQGYGESRPVASNDIADGRARNRRIDIVIVPEWAIR